MRVRVHLFAVARQRAGRSVVEVEVPGGSTVADLKAALGDQVPDLAPILPAARFAVEAEYADDATPIPPGADVALIPPVSGGSGGP
jgi:molybdopterin converting factor small subunit